MPELPVLLPSEFRSLRSLRRHPRPIPEEDYLVLNRLGLAARDYAVLPGGDRAYAEELFHHTARPSVPSHPPPVRHGFLEEDPGSVWSGFCVRRWLNAVGSVAQRHPIARRIAATTTAPQINPQMIAPEKLSFFIP